MKPYRRNYKESLGYKSVMLNDMLYKTLLFNKKKHIYETANMEDMFLC